MSVLSDKDLKQVLNKGLLKIKSPLRLNIQPSSLDVHLAGTILIFVRRRIKDVVIDVKKPIDEYIEYEKMEKNGTVLHPHEFILGVTTEWFELSNQIMGSVEGKSSLGRLGLIIHATAGYIDPGFSGHITLEITNLTEQPMIIYPYMAIGQVRFSYLSSPSEKMYGDPSLGSKKYKNPYSQNPKPKPSEYWKNFIKE